MSTLKRYTFLFSVILLLMSCKEKVYNLADYGLQPNSSNDASPIFAKAMEEISRTAKGEKVKIILPPGTYHFYPEQAIQREYYISNHSQDNPKSVGLSFDNMQNFTFDGQGSELLFHGRMLPISVVNTQNGTLKNFHIDFPNPHISQVKILENDTVNGTITYEIAPWVEYEIKDSTLICKGRGWEHVSHSGIAFEEKTKRIIYQTADSAVGSKHVTERSPRILVARNWRNPRLTPGTVVAFRGNGRPTPGIFISNAQNTVCENIQVHYAEGMGLLAQLSENITLDNFSVALRGDNDPRYFTTQADATHFSGCKGKIISQNGRYEGMMDDAINVHGTYLKVIKKEGTNTLLARYMHHESYGFDWGYPGDEIQFINPQAMEVVGNRNRIQTISATDSPGIHGAKEFRIVFENDLDQTIGDNATIGLENLTWTPEVTFSGNTVRNNRARGSLFSTPKRVLVEKNLFDHTSGSAILLSGDCNGWFETGACQDVTIRENKFINSLTNMYQFTNAIISIYPVIPELDKQVQYFHKNIKIENNVFETFDRPIVYAKSVDNLVFKNNVIRQNTSYPSFHWNEHRFFFEHVTNYTIENNTFENCSDDQKDVKSIEKCSSRYTIYDPMLDPRCKILTNKKAEKWNSSYMWYPGQLSAHLQKTQRKLSSLRCCNVGYPGNFNKDEHQTFFRKTINLPKKTRISWAGPEKISCFVNGTETADTKNGTTLEPGKQTLLFKVKTSNGLPCIMIDDKEIADIKGWEVSLDQMEWNKPESCPTYNSPGIQPDMKQDISVEIPPFQISNLQNASHTNGILSFEKNSSAILDFWHLEVGNVKLSVKGKGRISFKVGESIQEASEKEEARYEQNPIPDYVLTGAPQEIVLPERALRYLKIEVQEHCTVSSVNFEALLWPVKYLMEFECSDQAFNNIWNAGSGTLHTSMHNFYLDGIKRDYLPWAMDAIVSALAGDYLFGDEQVSRNGLSIALTPPDPQRGDFGIVDYPLHALIGFKHDYLRYGKLETSLLYKKRILQMMDLYESIQDKNGFIPPINSGFIPGWATKMGPDGSGVATYGQILLYYNFKIASYFAGLWKENQRSAHYNAKAEQLKKSILSLLWDEKRKVFINGYYANGTIDTRISHHAQYWAILADIFPKEHYDHLFEQVLPEIPYYKEDISYEKGYEFLAYIKAGRVEEAYSFLNAVWGDWLQQGHSRFPENFSPKASADQQLVFYGRSYGLSLCHGGNGVPPVVLALHGILGFSQSDQNTNEYYFRPELLNMSWAKGKIPIKEGFIHAFISAKDKCSLTVPPNTIVHIMDKKTGKVSKTFDKAGTYSFSLYN